MLTPGQRESFSHAALVLLRKLSIGTSRANDRLRELLKTYGSCEKILHELTGETPETLSSRKLFQQLEQKLEIVPLSIISYRDERYPQALQQPGYSPLLYTQGNQEHLSSPSIAVVGTRGLEDERDRAAGQQLMERLLHQNYVIVSGLARGADTLAHSYAVEHGGRTIAVLGTPLDKSYPAENRLLQERIAREHLLISQYPIGIRTFPSFFAHRNATTVALASGGVVVIKAGDRSGTQHAIRECLNQGKPLYVLENNLHQGYLWTQELEGKYKVVRYHEASTMNAEGEGTL